MKSVIASLDEVAEPLRGEYEPKDGKYVLKVDGDLPGFVPAARHSEFRENNVKLLKALGAETVEAALQRAGLFTGLDADRLAALKEIDPAEYRALKTKAEELERRGVKKPDDVDTLKAAILAEMKTSVVAPLQQQLADMAKASQAKDQRINEAAVRNAVTERFLKMGGRPNAAKVIVAEALKNFRALDDQVVPIDGKFGSDGNALTVDEWLIGQTKENDFAFEPSKGGGAPSNGNGGGSGGSATTQIKGAFKTSSGAEVKTDGIAVLQ